MRGMRNDVLRTFGVTSARRVSRRMPWQSKVDHRYWYFGGAAWR
jgi:hypothetical protein